MLQFGNLTIVEKTFTREGGATREQAYTGLKFRRYESNNGKKEAEEFGDTFVPFVKEQFIVSNAAFEKLGLEENALVQAVDTENDRVLLLVVEDQDIVKPEAKILRRSFSKKDNNAPLAKGKMFSNDFLTADLTAVGVLDKDKFGNQYLALTDVTSEVEGLPKHIKAVYSIIVDTTVDASKDEEVVVESNKF